jgi:phage terminase large subunit
MEIVVNPLYLPVFTSKCRYYHLWGGRGRGASHFATDYFLFLLTQPAYFRGVMLRATLAQIKKSLWVALERRINTAIARGYIDRDDLKINLSERTVTYIPTGNVIICHGFRKTTKAAAADLKGIEGCTHAIVEEAEDVFQQDFRELSSSLRTTEVDTIQIFVLFNPPSKHHWLIKTYYDLVPVKQFPGWYTATQKRDTDELMSIHSTYLDNIDNLNRDNIREYENYGNKEHHTYNEDYFRRSVLGLVSEGKLGRIFMKVKRIRRELYDELPYPEFVGIDFGFNDPTAVTGNKFHNGRLYSRQIVYEEEMEDRELGQALRKGGVTREMKGYADAQEEKSIRKLQRMGFNVIAAVKGPNSIEWGYRELLDIEWYVTDDSEDFWEELEEHSWELDADKKPTDTPEDCNNHLIDATRYAYVTHVARTGGKSGIHSERGTVDDADRSRSSRLLDSIRAEAVSDAEEIGDDDVEEFYASLYNSDSE